jgi:spore germination protein GerM
MQEQQLPKKRRSPQVPPIVIAGIAVVVGAAIGGATLWGWDLLTTSDAPLHQRIFPTNKVDPGSGQVISDNALVYWVSGEGEEVELVARPITIEDSARPQEMLESAFKRLLAGENTEEVTSAIPAGTQLRSVRLGPEGIHVDLSEEFRQGGGSLSMTARVGQVLYTATSLNPDANVWFEVEGEPLEVLGGEGLIVDQPMTRASFEANFEF